MLEIYLKKWCHKHEKDVLNEYARTRVPFYVFISMNYLIAIIAFSLGPILIDNQKLPINSWYPFTIDSEVVLVILYMQQIIGIVFSAGSVFLDFIGTTLLWSVAAKIELLQSDFQRVLTETELKSRVRKHQQLIRYL